MSLTASVTALEERAFAEVIKVNEAIRVRPYSNRTGVPMRRRDSRNEHT